MHAKNTIQRKERTLRDTWINECFEHLKRQNAKNPIWIKKKYYPKLVVWVYFILLFTIAKMYAKHPIWRKETTYPETCLLGVMHQNAKKKKKKHGKNPIWENKKLPKKVSFECF